MYEISNFQHCDKNRIFQYMSEIFCALYQRYPMTIILPTIERRVVFEEVKNKVSRVYEVVKAFLNHPPDPRLSFKQYLGLKHFIKS